MANRFWVGDGGNWSDATNHWAAATGGAPGAGNLPTNADNVYFDANSFTAPGQTVTVDDHYECKVLDFTGVTNEPTLDIDAYTLGVFGSITLDGNVSVTSNGDANFIYIGDIAGNYTITSNSCVLGVPLIFETDLGNWTLADAFESTSDVEIRVCNNFDTDGNSITCRNMVIGKYSATNNLVVTLDSSVTISGNFTYTGSTFAPDTFTDTNATIELTGASKTFAGGDGTFTDVTMSETCAITGSNTFTNLTLTAGKTYTLAAATTQTITTATINGSSGNLITIQSSSNTTQAIISISGTDYWTVDYCKLSDISFIGTAVKYATNSVDGGNNLGIEFKTTVQALLDLIDEIYPNQATDAQVCSHLNSAARKYLKEMKLKKVYTFATVADQETYFLPTNCDFQDITFVGVTTDTTIDDESEFTEYEFVKLEDIQGTDTTERYYNAENHKIGLLPVIDSSTYNVKIIYYAKMRPFSANNLSDVIDINENWQNILTYYVASLIASMGNDPDVQIADYWRRMAEEEYAMCLSDLENTNQSDGLQVEEYIC